MTPSDSSHEGQETAKRSRPDEAKVEESVYHRAKMSRSDLYKPPTAQELNQLKEAESLFHCSLLKMQVRPLTNWHRIKKEENEMKSSGDSSAVTVV